MDEEIRVGEDDLTCKNADPSPNITEIPQVDSSLDDISAETNLEVKKEPLAVALDSLHHSAKEISTSSSNGLRPVLESPLLLAPEASKPDPPKLTIRTTKFTALKLKNDSGHLEESHEKDETSAGKDAEVGMTQCGSPGKALNGQFPQIMHSSATRPEALSDKTNQMGSSNLQNGQKGKPSHLYQGLLNDTLTDGGSHEQTKRKLRRIKRRDLENLVIEQFYAQVFYENELGYQRSLCQRLESTLEAANKRALKLSMEVEDLKNITYKLEKEHKLRKGSFVLPSQVKRSVGIQCHLANTCKLCHTANSKLRCSQSLSRNPKKRKLDVYKENDQEKLWSPSSNHIKSPEKEIHDTISDEWLSLYNNKSFSDDPPDFKPASILKNNSANNFKNGVKKNSTKLPVRFKDDQLSLYSEPSFRHPDQRARPLQPILKVKRKHRSIVLSWNMEQGYSEDRLHAFQLFACETDHLHSMQRTWHSIGEVKALELPMMCTLADFKPNCYYHFSIRGIDQEGRRGPFSKPCTVYMP